MCAVTNRTLGTFLLQLKKALEAVLAQPGARKPSSARFFRGQMQVRGQARWVPVGGRFSGRYQSGGFPGVGQGSEAGLVEQPGAVWLKCTRGGGVIGPTGRACPAAQRDQPPCLRRCVQTIISRALSDMGITPVPSRRCFTLMSELLWLGGSVGLAKGSAAALLLPGACKRCVVWLVVLLVQPGARERRLRAPVGRHSSSPLCLDSLEHGPPPLPRLHPQCLRQPALTPPLFVAPLRPAHRLAGGAARVCVQAAPGLL